MTKKATSKKSTPETIDDQFNTEICNLKHVAIEKEFENIKTDAERRHEEMKGMIISLQENIKKDVETSHDNLRDKIVLVDKTVGDKIDSLSEFDDTLKGNGNPGIWESIRSIKIMIKILITIVTFIIILELGGSINRINWDVIKEKLWGPPKTKQVEKEKIIEEGKIGAIYIAPEEEKNEPEKTVQ